MDTPVVPVADLNILRRQWPLSVVSGMSRKQTDHETLRHECNGGFVVNEPNVARLAERLLRTIWGAISPVFTLIWPSYGGAHCRGVQPGRVRHRTAWTTL